MRTTDENASAGGGSVAGDVAGAVPTKSRTTEKLLSADQAVYEHRIGLTHVIAATPGWFVVYENDAEVNESDRPRFARWSIAGWARNDEDQLDPLVLIMETGGKPRLMLAERACKIVGIVSPGSDELLVADDTADLTGKFTPSKRGVRKASS